MKEGDVLASKYRVDGVLGVGGMGVVVAATHVQLGQRVAVKFLLPEALRHAAALERFGREARAAVRLRSDHVARVLDVGTLPDGAPYMVMEYLDGCDLGALVQEKGALSIGDAVEFVLQACDAVAEAHSLGIVHRDLKPRNLFLTRKLNGAPCVKVLDFGISKVTTIGQDHSLTKTTDVIGSPNYMAPEQIRSAKEVDERTDIWALGVILYELVSGRVPFLADTVPALCALVLEKAPTPLEELRPDTPPELRHVIARCLAKDPRQRFQSVAELASVLTQFVSGPSVASTVRWSSDNPPPARTVIDARGSSGAGARVVVSGGTSVTWGETQLGAPKSGVPVLLVGGLAMLVAAVAVVGTIAFVKQRAPVASATSASATIAPASSAPIEEPATSAITAGPIEDAGPPDARPHLAVHPNATATAAATPTATAHPSAAATATGGGDLPRERK